MVEIIKAPLTEGGYMGDWKDNLEEKANDAENKAHELKGRADQKKDDMNED